ncbi:MAG: hypothetical protein KAH17_07010 [Bacteroidales bacterium]|nr:hypothetical protein [Bacteroidales bacterium]
MRKILLIALLCSSVVFQSIACRYTVREIGFSSLSNSLYSIVIIDNAVDPTLSIYTELRGSLRDSNIGLIILDPLKDQDHPALKAATKSGSSFPTTVLWASNNRVLNFGNSSIESIIDQVLSSPLRKELTERFYNHFAFVILLESTHSDLNTTASKLLENSCENINNHMPNMPKQVTKGAELIRITQSQLETEKVMLWALGIDDIIKTPQAFIIYGRGRIIGGLMAYESILNHEVLKRLAMIGADCECGLDRKWMLGPQIPMEWPGEVCQQLADELGFDVDNPMVLAEMSHILSKEQLTNLQTDISFAPDEIDLDKFFATDLEADSTSYDEPESKNYFALIMIAGVLVILILIGSIIRKMR